MLNDLESLKDDEPDKKENAASETKVTIIIFVLPLKVFIHKNNNFINHRR